MFSWEKFATSYLDRIGLRSIKSRIIAFALIATLIPSLSMGWLSYRNYRRSIDEKIEEELSGMTTHASGDLSLWLRGRLHEMKVLSSSREVSENLETLGRVQQGTPTADLALRRLADYLQSIGARLGNYMDLVVLNTSDEIVASSPATPESLHPEDGWFEHDHAEGPAIGPARWDSSLQAGTLLITQPISGSSGEPIGLMVGKTGFGEIDDILAGHVDDGTQDLYLMTGEGRILTCARACGIPFMSPVVAPDLSERLYEEESAPLEYRGLRGSPVLGAAQQLAETGWGLVAEKDRASAYAAVGKLRNLTLALIAAVAIMIGLVAYYLGLSIVRPLGRLTRGASQIADGDLDVHLPLDDRSEVGYLTTVFNDMVARLRAFRDENVEITRTLRERNDELRTLSITDSLTGLYNRAQLSELLTREFARSKRRGHSFSILMIDIDHFKRFNDTHGHQAGDEVLRRVAETIRTIGRACDIAARYGGEEFLILLTETGPEKARYVAERLREKVEQGFPPGDRSVTISVGVASFPDHGDEVGAIIHEADTALYRGKRRGRNKVAVARTSEAGARVR